MEARRVGILCNPYSGSGKAYVLDQTRKAFLCLRRQVKEILIAPGDMGAVVCQGQGVRIIGTDKTHSRNDTIETVRQMATEGMDLIVVISGDGTYNDALEGIKLAGAKLPIFGMAAGRFNTIYPKRKHDPFVSMRGDFRPFKIRDLKVEDVRGILSRINGEIVSYAFFWAVVLNVVAYTDTEGKFITVDAAEYMRGRIYPITSPRPVADDNTRIILISKRLGEIELARGPNIVQPYVSQIVDEINQIGAAGFGGQANIMGFDGVAYCYTDPRILFLPRPEFFPIEQKGVAFYAGDIIQFSGLRDGSVFQADSTAIRVLSSDDVLTAEVVLDLGMKAILTSN